MWKILLNIIILFLILCNSSCSKTSREKSIIIEEIDCKLAEREYNEINKVVDFEYEFYHSVFKVRYPIMKVKLFGDSLKYRKFQENFFSDSENGFYSKKKKLAIVNKNENFMKTIFHELNHVIMDYYVPHSPKWINEGLSEYFEFAKIKYGKIEINKQYVKVAKIKKWLAEKTKINLEDFFCWSNKNWLDNSIYPEKFSRTLSWGLVYFFMEDPVRKYVLKQILIDLRNGKNSLSAISRHYPDGIKQLKIDFKVFVELKL